MWNFSNDATPMAFGVLPAGNYNLIVEEFEERTTKAGNKSLELTFNVTDGVYKGRKIFAQYNLEGNPKAVEISRGQLKALLIAGGKELEVSGPHEFVGLQVTGALKIKESAEYGDKNVISYFKKLTPIAKPDNKKLFDDVPF